EILEAPRSQAVAAPHRVWHRACLESRHSEITSAYIWNKETDHEKVHSGGSGRVDVSGRSCSVSGDSTCGRLWLRVRRSWIRRTIRGGLWWVLRQRRGLTRFAPGFDDDALLKVSNGTARAALFFCPPAHPLTPILLWGHQPAAR